MERARLNMLQAKPVAICVAYLLLTTFHYHIDKHTKGAVYLLLTVAIPILFLAIIWHFCQVLVSLVKTRQEKTPLYLPSTIACAAVLGYTFFSPYQASSEQLESEVVLRACYEGTQNQATIKFRQDKTFELNWTGVFFSNNWYTGTYTQQGDTLTLNYQREKPLRFGHLIIKKGRDLITIRTPQDSLQNVVPFYLGFCKHLN
jgi:hypothetical protein